MGKLGQSGNTKKKASVSMLVSKRSFEEKIVFYSRAHGLSECERDFAWNKS